MGDAQVSIVHEVREDSHRSLIVLHGGGAHELAEPRDVEADLGPRGGNPKQRAKDLEQRVLAHRVALGSRALLKLVEGDDAGVVHRDAEVPSRAPNSTSRKYS